MLFGLREIGTVWGTSNRTRYVFFYFSAISARRAVKTNSTIDKKRPPIRLITWITNAHAGCRAVADSEFAGVERNFSNFINWNNNYSAQFSLVSSVRDLANVQQKREQQLVTKFWVTQSEIFVGGWLASLNILAHLCRGRSNVVGQRQQAGEERREEISFIYDDVDERWKNRKCYGILQTI